MIIIFTSTAVKSNGRTVVGLEVSVDERHGSLLVQVVHTPANLDGPLHHHVGTQPVVMVEVEFKILKYLF